MSVMLSVPLLLPAAAGVKVTLIAQLAPAATVLPQLLVWAKSPFAVTLVKLSAAPPVLVSATACAALVVPTVWLPKLTLDGDKLTAAGVFPTPVRLTLCGLPLALSVMLSVPVRVPAAAGVKVTLIAQWAPDATALPQLFVWVKSPVAVMALMRNAAPPVLVRVTTCAALVVPSV